MLMHNKKSLTERVLELKKKYLQPANIIQKIKETAKNTALITITSAMLLGYATPVLASEPLTVKKYIQQNNYNLSSIFQLYLKPLNENGLDENEKKAIDIIANAPEEKQEQGKALAKEIYNNKGLTPKILAELEKLNLPSEKQEQVKGLEEKVTQKQENPVDIYAVIAVLDDAGDPKIFADLNSENITYALSFYWLLKNLGVSDKNIDFFVYHKHTKDIINTEAYDRLLNKSTEIVRETALTSLPHSLNDIVIDEEKFNKKDVLKSISNIKSDENDYVYILLDGHGTKTGKIGCSSENSVGWISGEECRNSIKKINGTVILLASACYSEKFIKAIGNLNSTSRKYLGIASCTSEERGGLGAIYNLTISARDNLNGTVEKIVKEANKAVEIGKEMEKLDLFDRAKKYKDSKFSIFPNVPMIIYPISSENIFFIPPEYTPNNN